MAQVNVCVCVSHGEKSRDYLGRSGGMDNGYDGQMIHTIWHVRKGVPHFKIIKNYFPMFSSNAFRA